MLEYKWARGKLLNEVSVALVLYFSDAAGTNNVVRAGAPGK